MSPVHHSKLCRMVPFYMKTNLASIYKFIDVIVVYNNVLFIEFQSVHEMEEIKNNLMKKQVKVRKRGLAPYSRLHDVGEPRYDFASAIAAREKVSCHQSSRELVTENRRSPCVKLSIIEDANDMMQTGLQVCLVFCFF
jgi:hypothetical protein